MSIGSVLVFTAKEKPCISDIHTYCKTFDAFAHIISKMLILPVRFPCRLFRKRASQPYTWRSR